MSASMESSSTKSRKTIFLADRDPLYLKGAESVLHDSGEWEVLAKVTTVREIIHHPLLPSCEVLISGLFLRCGRFFSVHIPELLNRHPALKILLLVQDTEVGLIPAKLRNKKGVTLIPRVIEPGQFPATLSCIVNGEAPPMIVPLSPRVDSGAASLEISKLSLREVEVFRLLGSGNSCREIASLLGISVKTCEAHRENIKIKLGVSTSRILYQIARSRVLWEQTGADHLL